MRPYFFGLLVSSFVLTATAAQFRGMGEGFTVHALSGNGRVAVGRTLSSSLEGAVWNCGDLTFPKIRVPNNFGVLQEVAGYFTEISPNGRNLTGPSLGMSPGPGGAIIWTIDSDFLYLGTRTSTAGILDNGLAAGTAGSGAGGPSRALRWQGGSLRTVSSNLFEHTSATAISKNGTILGYSSVGGQFRWTEETGLIPFDLSIPGF